MLRPTALFAGLFIAIMAAPTASEAGCPRRTTGTVVGAVAGGLLGSAVAGHGARTEGTLLGAGAGGLIGNQLTKCHHYRRAAYRTHRYRSSASYEGSRYAEADTCRYETQAYYDPYGRVVYQPTRVCRR